MAEFRCIRCGAIKEAEQPCSCPVCGYRMFKAPYDRREQLKNEIRSFVVQLRLNQMDCSALKTFREEDNAQKHTDSPTASIPKAQDEQRFPGFDKIQGYVCASPKTEIFYERLERSIGEIRSHLHTAYTQEYRVSLENTQELINKLDTTLQTVMTELGISVPLPEAALPELKLTYTETPDERLLPVADEILDELSALLSKLRRFIKQNNVYGTAYQHKPQVSVKSTGQEWEKRLRNCAEHLTQVLKKSYTVDIFSDGSEELGEMLKALWNAVGLLLAAPVLEKKNVYHLPDGETATDHSCAELLLARLNSRYAALDAVLYADNFLSDKTEDELLSLYDRMIELDVYGIMGMDKSRLLKVGDGERRLNAMIGLAGIKESIQKIKAYALANKDRGDLNIHMCFCGNPGSGKTEVARLIAEILYENKILPTQKIVEVDRSGLVSQYFGATAEKTSQVIASAMGGVLFIDEAYALGNSSAGNTDYGKEAIDTLVKAMEDHRGKFCVILAGYKNEMLQMLSTNPGFRSRIQFMLDFPNYSRKELKDIAGLMLRSRQYTIGETALEWILDITDIRRKDPNFANARELRNILDQVILCQNLRCAGTADKELGIADVKRYMQDTGIVLPTVPTGANKRFLTGEEELEQLIGLEPVKRMIRKIKAYAKRNKGTDGFNLHMCFCGNPGTGKTEVARILSRILYDAGVLKEAKLVETDGHGLLGQYVGETAPKTEAKLQEAMNGVLFIDEAYSLMGPVSAGGGSVGYGEDAIAVLLKEMEDRRGQFCVILAGYKNEMTRLLRTNPGFESRIQFVLDFPDYSREELGAIARKFLKKNGYSIEESALESVLDITDYYRKNPNFANARTVRNILDQVIMNQNLRTEDTPGTDDLVTAADVEEYLTDEGIDPANF